ncbi:MAG: hypothetical protein FJ279_02080, partial [Planctomycetes bacterium]|nr:hypothetical protein [Planctomycetota bacterium]
MKLPALTYKTRAVWNKALAKLCRIKLDFAQYPPDFLAGLRRNGTCDNALVNGDLLLKVMLRIPCVTLHKTPMGTWA